MELGALIAVFLTATVKFMFAPPIGVAAHVDYWTIMLVDFAGGVVGILFFFYLFKFMNEKFRQRMVKKRNEATENGKQPKRFFTKKNRLIVKMKNKLGFYGVIFIALPVISIPIEGFVCAKFYKHRKEVVPMMVLSVALWAFLLVTFYEFFIDGFKAYFL